MNSLFLALSFSGSLLLLAQAPDNALTNLGFLYEGIKSKRIGQWKSQLWGKAQPKE